MGSKKGAKRGKYKKIINNHGTVECNECGNQYKRKPSLLDHIRIKHLNKKVLCYVCNKSFISTSGLNRHIKNAHKLLIYHRHKKLVSKTEETDKQASFPSMSKKVSMARNKKFGKHLVAKCDINVGETLLKIPPFASIDIISSVQSRCFSCGKQQTQRFIKCQHCIDTHFCTKRCSLSQTHLSKCKQIFHHTDCHVIRLAAEIIITAFKRFPDEETFYRFVYAVMIQGQSFEHCLPPYSVYSEVLCLKYSDRNQYSNTARRIVKCLMLHQYFASCDQSKQRMLYLLALQHSSTIELNVFSETVKVGVGGSMQTYWMYDVLCRFNHACVPNVEHTINDTNITNCITLRPIKKGEQLFINYLIGQKFDNADDRRDYIRQQWNFVCKCEMCRSDEQISRAKSSPLYYIKKA